MKNKLNRKTFKVISEFFKIPMGYKVKMNKKIFKQLLFIH
jgi:hypothetical protein